MPSSGCSALHQVNPNQKKKDLEGQPKPSDQEKQEKTLYSVFFDAKNDMKKVWKQIKLYTKGKIKATLTALRHHME